MISHTDTKDTFKFHVKVGMKTMARDITTDMERALIQWLVKFPDCHLQTVGRRTTPEAARRWMRMGGKRRYRFWTRETA